MPVRESKVKSQKSKVQNKKTFPLPRRQAGFPLSPFPCSGYTLIELLIVIAIIAILSMTSLAYFNNFGVSQGVDRNVLIIQNAIEIAQTNASTGLKCPVSNSSLIGWLLEFSGANIDLKCQSKDLSSGDISDVTVKSYTLDTRAGISSITPPDDVCTAVSYPEHPIAIFYGSNATQNKFIFARGVTNYECQDAKKINIKVNYDGDANYKTFGINLSGAIN